VQGPFGGRPLGVWKGLETGSAGLALDLGEYRSPVRIFPLCGTDGKVGTKRDQPRNCWIQKEMTVGTRTVTVYSWGLTHGKWGIHAGKQGGGWSTLRGGGIWLLPSNEGRGGDADRFELAPSGAIDPSRGGEGEGTLGGHPKAFKD